MEQEKEILLKLLEKKYLWLTNRRIPYSKDEEALIEELKKIAKTKDLLKLSQTIDRAIHKYCKDVHGVSVDDPVKPDLSYFVHMYYCTVDDKKFYIIRSATIDPESWRKEYIIGEDWDRATLYFNDVINEIITYLEQEADMYYDRPDIVEKVHERMRYLGKNKY